MKVCSFKSFKQFYGKFDLIPVDAEILGDLDTPVSTFLKIADGPHRFLLESVEGGIYRGRYSIIGDSPAAIFSCKNGHSIWQNCCSGETRQFTGDPFNFLKEITSRYLKPAHKKIPFINSGLFGYLSYDCIRYIERLPELSSDDIDLPDIYLFLPQKIIVFDNLLNKIDIIYFVIPSGDPKKDYKNAVSKLEGIVNALHAGLKDKEYRSTTKNSNEIQIDYNVTKEEFEDIVEKAKQHINRGDIFQVVLSQRLTVDTAAVPFDIYRALRVINPSPYMFYMEMDHVTILGSSPETLVKLMDKRVTVKPIAGTRKRGSSEKEDDLLVQDLLSDPKERAEHTMLVDLGRNDIGRIAEYGSVEVEDLMKIEKYSHVIHIVSTVGGRLRSGMDAVDVFKAAFPAGTVSGAPKIRAMELIEEFEPTRRGIYAGAVGYFGFNGDMDTCIAIRTIYMKKGLAYLQAGAGIVADSVPSREYEETLNKARGLLKAIEYAEGGMV